MISSDHEACQVDVVTAMKKTSQRLQVVLKLARLRQQLAAEQLGTTLHNVETQQRQVEQLKHYQLDYSEHLKALGAQGTTASHLQNYQRFMDNLEQAVIAQQQRTVLAEDQKEQARSQWQQQYAREKNLEALVERKQREEQQVVDNRLQREQDDRRPVKPFF